MGHLAGTSQGYRNRILPASLQRLKPFARQLKINGGAHVSRRHRPEVGKFQVEAIRLPDRHLLYRDPAFRSPSPMCVCHADFQAASSIVPLSSSPAFFDAVERDYYVRQGLSAAAADCRCAHGLHFHWTESPRRTAPQWPPSTSTPSVMVTRTA